MDPDISLLNRLRRQLVVHKRILFQLLLLITGILAVIWGVSDQSDYDTARDVSNSIGTALVAAAVVDVTWNWIGATAQNRALLGELESMITQTIAVATNDRLGLVQASEDHIGHLDIPALAENAHTIRMALLSDPTWGELLSTFLQSFLARDSRNRIFIYTPDPSVAKHLAQRAWHARGQIYGATQ